MKRTLITSKMKEAGPGRKDLSHIPNMQEKETECAGTLDLNIPLPVFVSDTQKSKSIGRGKKFKYTVINSGNEEEVRYQLGKSSDGMYNCSYSHTVGGSSEEQVCTRLCMHGMYHQRGKKPRKAPEWSVFLQSHSGASGLQAGIRYFALLNGLNIFRIR